MILCPLLLVATIATIRSSLCDAYVPSGQLLYRHTSSHHTLGRLRSNRKDQNHITTTTLSYDRSTIVNHRNYLPLQRFRICRQYALPIMPSSVPVVNDPTDQSVMGNIQSLLSASIFVAIDVLFRRLFLRFQWTFPSSLGACGFLLTMLLTLPSNISKNWLMLLQPGAGLLAKWLPVFFVPSLVTLPLADTSALEVGKTLIVIAGGFLLTLLTTSYSVLLVRLVKRQINSQSKRISTTTTNNKQDKTISDVDDIVIDDSFLEEEKQKISVKHDVEKQVEHEQQQQPPQQQTEEVQLSSTTTPVLSKTVFSDTLLYTLSIWTVLTGVASLRNTIASQLLGSIFALLTTLTSFVYGSRLPTKLTQWVHPLVTCTALTWATLQGFGYVSHRSFTTMLRGYQYSAGTVLLFWLGPAVVSLAVSMFERRQLMRTNWIEVGTALGVSTLGGLFGTAFMVRYLNFASPYLRLSLLSRNITSPLAMAIAGILGADISLAVSIVVVTGLLGANFGAIILNGCNIRDAVARGLGIGAAAHGLGTAAITNEPDAFPFAAIAMALTATAATVTVSIPALRKILLQLALDV